eukprot:CFRG1222T1
MSSSRSFAMFSFSTLLSTFLLTPLSMTDACTAVCVSKGASANGVPMTAHSDDCVECDTRVALVPGRYHEEGTLHPIYGVGHLYPRAHGDRATIYRDTPEVPVLAHIPEVEHTYGVWEITYALMNEKGLTFGESTCGSKITAGGIDMPDPKTGIKGPAKLSISALMQLGLERCVTAICAVETMGALAEEHGFYGEGFMSGEALTIADKLGDAWVFHIVQTYTRNDGAIWCAQRVPIGHVAVVANSFSIKEIPYDPSNSDYKYSTNMYAEAMAAGFWKGRPGVDDFSWVDVFATSYLTYYTTVRVHWILSQVAPSLNLTVSADPFNMPFSAQVDEKITVTNLMNLYRGFYEGTDHDMSRGILAGPFRNPHRVEGGDGIITVKGQFTRAISIPRTAYTHIGYPDPAKPVAWVALDEPANSVFVPFLSSTIVEAYNSKSLMDTAKLYSHGFQVGCKSKLNRESAWWAFDIVANWMNINYHNMSVEVVQPAVRDWQAKMITAYEEGSTAGTKEAQDSVTAHWWALFDLLVVRYNDGTYNFYPGYPKDKPHLAIGYPSDWLADVGFDNSWWMSKSVHGQCSAFDKNTQRSLSGYWLSAATLIIGFVAGWLVKYGSQNDKKKDEQEPLLVE